MLISFTGIDDQTDLNRFFLRARYVASTMLAHGDGLTMEAGVLFFPEKFGTPRNPSYNTRLAVRKSMASAAHLCGTMIFDALLDKNTTPALKRQMQYLLAELTEYDRIQVNINARGRLFTTEEVHQVYFALLELDNDFNIILQLNEDSADDIRSFVQRLRTGDYGTRSSESLFQSVLSSGMPAYHARSLSRIHLLLDGSRGKGVQPEKWIIPYAEDFAGIPIGIAGALGPGNNIQQMVRFYQETSIKASWLDMETGIRTDNQLDVEKVIVTTEEVMRALLPPKTPQPESTT